MIGNDDRETSAGSELFSMTTTICGRLIRLTADGHLPEMMVMEGEIVEIGGSGAKIITTEEFETGDLVCLTFLIPDNQEEMRLYGRVVGVSRVIDVNHLCTTFIGISEKERGALLRYAYRQQIRAAMESKE
jgi:hypothetical protein